MNDIVEHVKRSVVDGANRRRAENFGLSELLRFQAERLEEGERAKDAIRATLQYARDNVSNEMLDAGYGHRYRLDTSLGREQAQLSARAMLSALLTQIEGGEKP